MIKAKTLKHIKAENSGSNESVTSHQGFKAVLTPPRAAAEDLSNGALAAKKNLGHVSEHGM